VTLRIAIAIAGALACGCASEAAHGGDETAATDDTTAATVGPGPSDASSLTGSGEETTGVTTHSETTGDTSSTSTSEEGSGGESDDHCVAPEAVAVAPPAQWANATGNLANMQSDCANLGRVAAVPCSQRVIAAIANAGLWASDDAGDSWQPLGTGDGSAVIDNRATSIVFDPHDPQVFWETGIFGSDGGLYRTDDGGTTFTALGTLTFTQLVGVDFGDPARSTLLAGTHGQKQQLHLSRDGGETWANVGLNLPADAHNSESPIVIDAATYLVGACGYGDGVCGIHRSNDAGRSWTRASELPTSHFGAPLSASDGAIYWPLLGDAGLAKSDDAGVTWTQVIAGTVVGVTPLELPDGSIAAVGTDHLMRSSDGGESWQAIGEPLPFSIAGSDQGSLAYSAATKTFFLSHWDCGTVVLPDAVMRAGFDPRG
jgi:photosystem II stability/assembly factor-like uncharacterized protein